MSDKLNTGMIQDCILERLPELLQELEHIALSTALEHGISFDSDEMQAIYQAIGLHVSSLSLVLVPNNIEGFTINRDCVNAGYMKYWQVSDE